MGVTQMITQTKYRSLPDDAMVEWNQPASIYSLDVLVKQPDGKFIAKMLLQSKHPDKGVGYIEHYASCHSCKTLGHEGRAYGIFLFCDNRFVYGYDLLHNYVLSNRQDYINFLRGL